MPVQHADFGMGCTLLQCSPKMTQPSTLCGTLKSASAFEMNNNNNKWQWLCIRKQPTGWLTSRDRTGPVLGSGPGRSIPGLGRSQFFLDRHRSDFSAIYAREQKNDNDAGWQAGDCLTVYTFASYQGCNDMHVSLKCVADVCGGTCWR